MFGLGSTKENSPYSYGGFVMFWQVNKFKIDPRWGGFLMGLGSTEENSPYCYGGFLMFWQVNKIKIDLR